MLHPAEDLRASIRTALLAQPDIAQAVSGIYETAPAKTPTPYITLGDDRIRDWSTQSFEGVEHQLIINVWSGKRNFGELYHLHRLIQACLTHPVPALTDHKLVVFFAEEERFLTDRKRRARLGVLRYRALMHPLTVPA